MDLALYNAALPAAQQPPPPPLTNDEKQQWNGFIDYLDKKGLRGSALLDNKDTSLGAKLISEYQSVNPNFTLGYDRVSDVQNDLQNYRNQLFKDYQQGKVSIPGVRTVEDVMPGISQVDGWLGSKTSNYKYPSAYLTQSQGNSTKTTNYGVNTAAYDAAMTKLK